MLTEAQIEEFTEYLNANGQTLGDQVLDFGSQETQTAVLNDWLTEAEVNNLSESERAQLSEIWKEKIVTPYISIPYEKIPKEIMATEKTYLKSLLVFMEATRGDKYAQYPELQAQRNEIAKMIALSQEFLLLAKTADVPPQNRTPSLKEIGDFLNTHASAFKAYTEYAIHYSNYEKVTDIKKEPGKSIHQNLQKAGFIDTINSLTIQPIQRIPRYELFFVQLLKENTLKDAPSIPEALNTIKRINKNINEIPDSQKKFNILKKQQKLIQKYIEEIEKIKINDLEEKQYWKKEINVLKKTHKALNNPQSIEAQKFITARFEHESIELIQTQIQARLDKFLGNDDPLLLHKDSELNMVTLKNKVLSFFALEEAAPIPAKIFERSKHDNAENIGPGIAVLFSKIAGTLKRKSLPEDSILESIQKDIEQMRTLYQKEIPNIIKKEQNEEKKQLLNIIYTNMPSQFNLETFLENYKNKNSYTIENNLDANANPSENKIYLLNNGEYKLYNPADPNATHTGSILQIANTPGILSRDQKTELQSMLDNLVATLANAKQAQKLNNLVMKLISKQYNIKPKDEKNFSENISEFILSESFDNAVYPDIDINDEENQAILKALSKEVSTKFLELHAPAAHKKSIKQLNEYIKQLEINLKTLKDEIGKKEPNLVQVGEQRRLNEKLNHAQELHGYLINPDPNTLVDNLEKVRNIGNALVAPDTKKDELITIVEETLKMSDPYYSHIKKLDKYLAQLEKDLEKNPQNPDVAVGPKESDRLIKRAIAQEVRELLLHPTTRDPQTGVINQELTINRINGAITRNTSFTHTLLGISKGRLDPILKDILSSIQPLPSSTKKRKP